jgi:hypothetical protein
LLGKRGCKRLLKADCISNPGVYANMHEVRWNGLFGGG